MKKNKPKFYDIADITEIRLLAIKVETPNRDECNWTIGLTDHIGTESPLNYFQCETTKDATDLLNKIITEYSDLTRGEDFGLENQRFFVYIQCA